MICFGGSGLYVQNGLRVGLHRLDSANGKVLGLSQETKDVFKKPVWKLQP